MILEPIIDLIQAQETALEGQGDAVVTSVDFDGDTGMLVYNNNLENGIEVMVNATTGEILRTDENSGAEDDESDDGEEEDDSESDDCD